jgi:hypothetical protein
VEAAKAKLGILEWLLRDMHGDDRRKTRGL